MQIWERYSISSNSVFLIIWYLCIFITGLNSDTEEMIDTWRRTLSKPKDYAWPTAAITVNIHAAHWFHPTKMQKHDFKITPPQQNNAQEPKSSQ